MNGLESGITPALLRRWWAVLVLACCCLLWPGGAVQADGGGGQPVQVGGQPPTVAGQPQGGGQPQVGGQSQVDPMRGLDAQDLQGYLRQLNQRMDRYGIQFDLTDFSALYRSGDQGQSRGLLPAFGRYLVGEVLANSRLLAQLVLLAVAAAVLQSLQSSLSQSGAGSFAYTVVYLALAGAALGGFALAVGAARTVVHDLSTFLDAALPVLLTLLVGSGALTSAALLQPVVLLLTGTVANVVTSVILPLLLLVAAVDIVSGFHPEFKLTQLSKLLRQGALSVISLCFTVFFGLVSVKAFAGAVTDGVALRSTRYLASAAIPVVGKLFADAAELVVGSATVLRTGVGLIGAVAVAFVVAFPLLKILSIMFIYRAAAAMVQPVGGKPVVSCLHTLAANLGLLLICVALVGLMFFVAVAAMVGASNMTLMMR